MYVCNNLYFKAYKFDFKLNTYIFWWNKCAYNGIFSIELILWATIINCRQPLQFFSLLYKYISACRKNCCRPANLPMQSKFNPKTSFSTAKSLQLDKAVSQLYSYVFHIKGAAEMQGYPSSNRNTECVGWALQIEVHFSGVQGIADATSTSRSYAICKWVILCA